MAWRELFVLEYFQPQVLIAHGLARSRLQVSDFRLLPAFRAQVPCLGVESYVVHAVFVVGQVAELVVARDSLITNGFVSAPELAVHIHRATGKHVISARTGNTGDVIADVTVRARRGQDEGSVVVRVVVFKLIVVGGTHDLFHLFRILAIAEYRGEVIATCTYQRFGVSAVRPNRWTEP